MAARGASAEVDSGGQMSVDRSSRESGDAVQREPRSITNLQPRSYQEDKMGKATKNKSKASKKAAAKRRIEEVGGQELSEEGIAQNTKLYEQMFPNWNTPVNAHAPHRVEQASWDGCFETQPDGSTVFKATEMVLGRITQRRAAVLEQGKALAQVLTYDTVEGLLEQGLLSPPLAREWGSYMEYAQYVAPFNMVAKGLEGVSGSRDEKGALINPAVPPPPRTDSELVIGLVSPSKDSTLHFKGWYESKPDCNFEKDLLMPLFDAFRQYRDEYPHVRHYPLGLKSTKGRSPSATTKRARKYEPAKYDTMAPWPNVDVSFPAGGPGSEDSSDDEDAPVFVTKHGAPLFFTPPSLKRRAEEKAEAKKAAVAATVQLSPSDGTTSPQVPEVPQQAPEAKQAPEVQQESHQLSPQRGGGSSVDSSDEKTVRQGNRTQRPLDVRASVLELQGDESDGFGQFDDDSDE